MNNQFNAGASEASMLAESRHEEIRIMQCVRFGVTFGALLVAAVLSGCAKDVGPARTEVAAPARIEPRADEALRRMSTALGDATSFSFRGITTMDEPLPDGQLGQFSRETKIVVRRPDRLFAEIQRSDKACFVWYMGTDLTILDQSNNTWASDQVLGRINDMLDDLARKYHLTMPLADLLFADPYKVLTANVLTGRFVGMDKAGGVECTHLLFTQDNVDWQIWIEAGQVPVPRKIVIDYKKRNGRPQFMAMLSDWNLSAAAGDDQFKPAVPEGARKVGMAELLKTGQEHK
jgi:hypothetical protein